MALSWRCFTFTFLVVLTLEAGSGLRAGAEAAETATPLVPGHHATGRVDEPADHAADDGHSDDHPAHGADAHGHDDHAGYENRPRVDRITEVPDRTLVGVNTASRDLKSLIGPGTIVHFWASWCAPCREEFPEIEHFYNSEIKRNRMLSDVTLIAVSNDARIEDAERFLGRTQVSFPIYIDDRSALNGELLGSLSLPATVIIDASGAIHRLALGKFNWLFPGLPEILAKTIAVKTGSLERPGSIMK